MLDAGLASLSASASSAATSWRPWRLQHEAFCELAKVCKRVVDLKAFAFNYQCQSKVVDINTDT